MGEERLKALTLQRRNRKGVVTRSLNTLNALLKTEDVTVAAVKDQIESVDEAFKVVEKAHLALMDMIENEEEFTKQEEWIAKVQTDYESQRRQAMAFVRNGDKGPTTTTKSTMDSLVKAISLPRPDLQPFDGDPIRYWPFIRAFDVLMSDVSDDNFKLTTLMKYCRDKAYDALQCCLMRDPSDGYKLAREILSERFGDKGTVVQTWVAKIVNRPKVDVAHLRQFSDDLSSCRETLDAMGFVGEIDNQRALRTVIDKLPRYLQTRWVREYQKIKSKGNQPNIGDVVNFIKSASKEANDPVFGSLITGSAISSTSNDKSTGKQFKSIKGTYAVDVTRNVCCPMCTNSHSLFNCKLFKEKPVEERLAFVKSKHLCFNCLRAGHGAFQCSLTRTCSVAGCGRKHTKFLHLGRSTPEDKTKAPQSSPTPTQVGHASHASTVVALPILPVKVRSPTSGIEVTAYALLDNGSTSTFCTERLARELRAEGRQQDLVVNTINDRGSIPSRLVSLEVRSLSGGELISLPCVYSTKTMSISSTTTKLTKTDLMKWPYLKGIPLTHADNKNIDILIGLDVPDALQPLEVRAGFRGEPYATRTRLGWSLNGPIDSGKRVITTNFVSRVNSDDINLDTQLQKFWSYDHEVADSKGMSINDRKVLDLWDKKVEFHDGHYHLPIPFKEYPSPLVNNRMTAEARLRHLRKKLINNNDLKTKYADVIKKLIDDRHAEPVDSYSKPTPNWYLPHHAVPKKDGSLRVVFDCASKHMGKSLNDTVMQGPDLVNSLVGVLMRFRRHKYALMGDIQSMFHQVRVPAEERNVLKFLWWSDDQMTKICTYRMCVHLFGGTWCPSASTYALRQTSKDNTVDVDDKIRNIVNENFYVDDALISVADEEDGVRIIRDLTSLLSSGGFKLTKWLSNSPTILREVPVGDRATTVKDLDLEGTLPTEKALGIRWDVQNDAFGFNVSVKHVPKTRRGVLSALSSVFDPLGFVAPFTLKGKLIVQQLVRRRVGWDDPAPDDLLSKWELWQNELIHLEELKIRRCLRKDEFGDVVTQDLHHFADASEVGYGVASYLHMKNQHGDTQSTLVFARSRLCPIKRVTIPRLELMAATLAVTTDTFLRKELGLNVGGSYFWTDSMIVLQYIRNDERRFKTFVSNRLATIHNGSSSTQWRHIDGKRNPADLASRGLDAKQLVGNMLWYEGPEFLRRNDTMWPIQPDNSGDTYEDDPELKKDERVCHHIQKEDSAHILNILISRYASWTKLKRTIAWLLRFKSFIVLKKRKGLDKLSCVDLTVGEVQEAELEILKYVQSTHLSSLSALKGLDAYRTDDGLIRVGGRVKLQDKFSYDQKHQIILPSDHDATNLIINYYHLLTGHGGVERVLAETRQKYWIVRGRRNVRRELSKCITCKRIKAPPLQQIMGLLPTSRLAIHEQPFSRVGVDYFGPLTVKRGRTECKRYGCIFSCLTTRAVHIEVTNSLTTDTFINAFHRFIARRGSPQEVISDNGTNFIGAKQEFKKAVKEWNQKTINDFMVQKEIKWSFNPPTASHMGGIWERQIRSIRTIIFSLVRQQTLDDEGVNTLMCIVEGIINSRPLTKLSDDPKDDNPLTPNHLLLLRGGPLLPPGHFVEQDIYRRRWRQIQYLADVFWRRWVKEYLPLLQIRQKWVFEKRDVKVGDLVLVTDKNTPRYQWPLALVVDVYKGSDEHVRSVKIRMRGSTYERPITKLCLLEGVD